MSFGSPQTWVGGSPVEGMMDSVYGEYHRGLDYAVPEGTTVQAPAAGTVLLAEPLALTGNTLVVDHGQGVISVFYHLSRIDVVPGQPVEARAPMGLSGDSGLAVSAHLHWGVYVSGVAVDPRVLARKLD
jgi:murein DD-endopeptidase MepM/ murein hydrolase activator NlpD